MLQRLDFLLQECFCYGISNSCVAASLGVEIIQHAEGWRVTDLRGRLLVDPYWSTVTNGITIAEEDMQVGNQDRI